MAEGLPTKKIVKDLVCKLTDTDEETREMAIEALAVSTWDEDWRPDDLIQTGGIEPVIELLEERNTHIVESALDVIMATAAAGEQEVLISAGALSPLGALRDHSAPELREKAKNTLWLLEPEVEDVVIAKPQDEY